MTPEPPPIWMFCALNELGEVCTVTDGVIFHNTLAGKDGIRSTVIPLNGRDPLLGENDALPCLCGEEISVVTVEVATGVCTLFVL